jgi:hypothetical protein
MWIQKGGRLVVNTKEAAQVKEIYRIAAAAETLEEALRTIQTRGIRTKAWTTRGSKHHVARPFSRMTLRLAASMSASSFLCKRPVFF